MLVLVPEPVWNTSMGKCRSCLPSATSSAAASMALARARVQHAQILVHSGGRGLDEAQGTDEGPRHGQAADGEVLHSPLGLGTPECIRRYLQLTHAVVFDPEGLVRHHLLLKK